jgi:hypothetical protein
MHHVCLFTQRHSGGGYWPGGISLHYSHWPDGRRNNAPRSDYRPTADCYVRKNDRTGAYEHIILDRDSFRPTKMSNQHCSDANYYVVPYRNQLRMRCIQQHLIPYPSILTDLYTTPPVKSYSQRFRARRVKRNKLQNTAFSLSDLGNY